MLTLTLLLSRLPVGLVVEDPPVDGGLPARADGPGLAEVLGAEFQEDLKRRAGFSSVTSSLATPNVYSSLAGPHWRAEGEVFRPGQLGLISVRPVRTLINPCPALPPVKSSGSRG